MATRLMFRSFKHKKRKVSNVLALDLRIELTHVRKFVHMLKFETNLGDSEMK